MITKNRFKRSFLALVLPLLVAGCVSVKVVRPSTPTPATPTTRAVSSPTATSVPATDTPPPPATATRTPTSLPTQTPTLALQVYKVVTATLTPTSPPTPVPTPTATPQPTPTPACPAVRGPFAAVWQTVQDTIGCAAGSVVTGLIAEESFQGGKMFWREPFDYAQVLALYNDGTWEVVRHRPYDEARDLEFSCPDENTPPRCPPTPKRGFGMVWCNLPPVRSRLGNALDCERGYQGSMQPFERGFMLRSDDGTVYVFYGRDRGWWERR